MAPQTQTREQQPSSSVVLESLDKSLTTASIQSVERKVEDINTVRFMFHGWLPILNADLAGFRFGVQHFMLKRMTLINIKTWPIPVITPRAPRAGGVFGIGALVNAVDVLGGGVSPGGANAAHSAPVLQYPSASVQNLLDAYGRESINNIGMVELTSLKAIEDAEKVESILLFRAVMETPIENDGPIGSSLRLEDVPRFLLGDALKLLARAVNRGVDISTDPDSPQFYKLSALAQKRGEGMIRDISTSVALAKDRATRPKTGILSQTKEDLIKAKAGAKDVKILPDERDNWLLQQFDYSMDTEVERSARAAQGMTESIAKGTAQQSDALLEMAANQTRLLEQLAAQGKRQDQLLEILAARPKAESTEPIT